MTSGFNSFPTHLLFFRKAETLFNNLSGQLVKVVYFDV